MGRLSRGLAVLVLAIAPFAGRAAVDPAARGIAFQARATIVTPKQCGAVPGTVSAAQQAVNGPAISACAARSIANHAIYLIDNLYNVSTAINMQDVSYLHMQFAGQAGFIQNSVGVPLLQLGGQYVQVDGPGLLQYAVQAGTTATELMEDGVHGSNALELWYLRRSTIQTLQMRNAARCIDVPQVTVTVTYPGGATATGSGQFSNVFGTIDCSYFSYRGIDMRAYIGGQTGSVFNNIYIRGHGINDRAPINIAMVMQPVGETIFNQLNIEHVKPGAVANLSSPPDNVSSKGLVTGTFDSLRIKSMHIEGIEPMADNMAVFQVNSNTAINVDGGELVYSYFLNSNGVNKFHLTNMYGTNPHMIWQGDFAMRGNTVTGATVDLGYGTTAVTGGFLLYDGPLNADVLTITGNTIPTNDQKVLKGVYGRVDKWPVVGRYYLSQNGNGTNTVVQSRLYAGELEVTAPFATVQLGFNVTTAQASSDCLVGIYYHDGSMQPGALVVQATAHTVTTSSGARTATIPTTILKQGRYWRASICYNTAGGTLPALTTDNQIVNGINNVWAGGSIDLSNINNSASAVSGVYADQSIADAATWNAYTLPATFPTATINVISGTPKVVALVAAIP